MKFVSEEWIKYSARVDDIIGVCPELGFYNPSEIILSDIRDVYDNVVADYGTINHVKPFEDVEGFFFGCLVEFDARLKIKGNGSYVFLQPRNVRVVEYATYERGMNHRNKRYWQV